MTLIFLVCSAIYDKAYHSQYLIQFARMLVITDHMIDI